MTGLALSLLGPVQISLDGNGIQVKRRKVLAMLAYLAVTAERHSRDALATLLWPDADRYSARKSLRSRLSEMNTLLGPDWVDADHETVALRTGYLLDVDEFRRHVAAGRNTVPEMIAATDLYRGDFLEGFTLSDCPEFDEWQLFQTEGWRWEMASTLERLATVLGDRGDYQAAIPFARRWLALDPLHEPAHRQLMRLYAHMGRQAAALRQFEACRQVLDNELRVSPDTETVTLRDEIRSGHFNKTSSQHDARPHPTPRQPRARRHNLPQHLTPFVGRRQEMDDLARLLSEPENRLITILAPGGMGKTRLALAVAAKLSQEYSDGAFFVPLAPLDAASSIVTAIAESVGYTFYGASLPTDQLINYLQDRSLLLVLDNFEHLLNGATLVIEILQAAPQVHVVVTSRERLNLQGETVYTLDGLAFPAMETPENLLAFDSAKLFFQSARRSNPNLDLHQSDPVDLACICRLTAGLPLGIELAAGWVDVLSLAQIAAELQAGIDILETDMRDVPSRHRSLTSTFERTWERLASEEQALFRRLSVFRGGFTMDAARFVAGAGASGLRGLAHKALIQVGRGDRFTVHELLRQFASNKLAEAGETLTVRTRHATFFADFMSIQRRNIKTDRQLEALELIDPDFENVRAAWRHLVRNHQWELISAFLHSLWFYCDVRSRGLEAVEMLELACDALKSGPSSAEADVMLARLLALLGWFYNDTGFPEEGAALSDKAIELLRPHGAPEDLIAALFARQHAGFTLHQPDRVVEVTREGLDIARSIGDSYWEGHLLLYSEWPPDISDRDFGAALEAAELGLSIHRKRNDRWGMLRAMVNLETVCRSMGQREQAIQWIEEALELANLFEHAYWKANCHGRYARLAYDAGDTMAAHSFWRKSLQIYWDAGYHWMAPAPLTGIALALASQNDCEGAVELLAVTEGHSLPYGKTDQKARGLRDRLKAQMTTERFQAAWARGNGREVGDLVAELLAGPASRKTHARSPN